MAPVLDMTDGQLVEYWRKKNEWTQEELAERVTKELRRGDPGNKGVTRMAVNLWENGHNGLTEVNRRAVIAAFGLTSVEFFRPEQKLAAR